MCGCRRPHLCDGVVHNLPACAARAAFDPVVALAQAGLDLQEDHEYGGIGLGDLLALPEMTCGRWVVRVEPNTVVGDGLAEVLGRAHTLCTESPPVHGEPGRVEPCNSVSGCR